MRRVAPLLALFCLVFAASCGGGGGSAGSGNETVVVANAAFPSAIAFAPDGRLFYTERATGQIRVVQNGALVPDAFASVPISTTGERGLLGIAIDPDFGTNGFVYVFHSEPNESTQKVVRFTAVGNTGTAQTDIVTGLPSNNNHNGGRIVFGNDGKLYVSVGDCQSPASSQNNNALAGKIHRYNANGTIPADNPIASNPMYAKGLRNAFGLAVNRDNGMIVASENGPNCDDELNVIVPSGNYGWRPSQPCGDVDPAYLQPLRRYSSIVAPTGVAFASNGDLLMATFGSKELRRLVLSGDGQTVLSEAVVYTDSQGGSLLDVAVGPDDRIYIATTTRIVSIDP